MKRWGKIAYGTAIAAITLLTMREVVEPSLYLYQKHTSSTVALGAFGWVIATSGPLALSICFWRLAERRHWRWVLHLLFLPCAITLFRAGAFILFYAAGVPDGDSIEGYTLLAGLLLLVLTILVHIAALAALAVAAITRISNAR